MTKSDPTLVFIRFLSFVFLCFFIHYLARTVYGLYLQRLMNCRSFLAPFVMVKYPAYDKFTVVDNLLITWPWCLDFVSGVGCLKTGNLRNLLVELVQSNREQGSVSHNLFLAKGLHLPPEVMWRHFVFWPICQQTLCPNSRESVGFFHKFASLVDNS